MNSIDNNNNIIVLGENDEYKVRETIGSYELNDLILSIIVKQASKRWKCTSDHNTKYSHSQIYDT